MSNATPAEILRRVARDLDRLRAHAEQADQPLLVSLLEVARAEAEDAAKSSETQLRIASELQRTSIRTGELETAIAAKVGELRPPKAGVE